MHKKRWPHPHPIVVWNASPVVIKKSLRLARKRMALLRAKKMMRT
jgi:hypothetical protein